MYLVLLDLWSLFLLLLRVLCYKDCNCYAFLIDRFVNAPNYLLGWKYLICLKIVSRIHAVLTLQLSWKIAKVYYFLSFLNFLKCSLIPRRFPLWVINCSCWLLLDCQCIFVVEIYMLLFLH